MMVTRLHVGGSLNACPGFAAAPAPSMFLLLLSISTFMVPLYMVYKPPPWLISYFQSKWPDVLWRVPTSSKVVALTIDDAPSEYTSEIAQILKDNDATATFFVIGSQVAGHEDELAALVRDGNELGNHAMRDEPSRNLDDVELKRQIEAVDEMLQEAYLSAEAQPPPKYFRPGSGIFSDRMRKLVTSLEYRLVLGSVYPHDPQIHSPWINARHVLSMVRPGSIIICHDRRNWTLPMLREVLPKLRKRGYRVVTVSQLENAAST